MVLVPCDEHLARFRTMLRVRREIQPVEKSQCGGRMQAFGEHVAGPGMRHLAGCEQHVGLFVAHPPVVHLADALISRPTPRRLDDLPLHPESMTTLVRNRTYRPEPGLPRRTTGDAPDLGTEAFHSRFPIPEQSMVTGPQMRADQVLSARPGSGLPSLVAVLVHRSRWHVGTLAVRAARGACLGHELMRAAPLRGIQTCARGFWNTNSHAVLAGRTMDWPESTEPVLTVFPRGLKRNGGTLGSTAVVDDNPLLWTSTFGSLVTTLYGAGTADGLNEAGLAAHMLYLDSTDLGPATPAGQVFRSPCGSSTCWTALAP